MQELAARPWPVWPVRFLGVRREVADFIRVARATVLTSDIEGLPNTLLEAQLAGCPVVATRAGGASEVVEDAVGGFLVEIGDHSAVAAKLAHLLDDPALGRTHGRAAAERSRRLFSVTRMGEETLEVYRELAQGNAFDPVPKGGSRPRPSIHRPRAPRSSLPVRALYRAAGAVCGRCEWLDALAYRLLALRYATRPQGTAPTPTRSISSWVASGSEAPSASWSPSSASSWAADTAARSGYRTGEGFFEAEIEDAGATWECIFDTPDAPWGGRLYFELWALPSRSHVLTGLALAGRLRRERPAVLQCLLDTTNVAGALAGRMAGVPVVAAGLFSLHPGERSAVVATRFQQRCYRLLRPALVDAVIANSKSGRDSFLLREPDDAGLQGSLRLERAGPHPAFVRDRGRDPPPPGLGPGSADRVMGRPARSGEASRRAPACLCRPGGPRTTFRSPPRRGGAGAPRAGNIGGGSRLVQSR